MAAQVGHAVVTVQELLPGTKIDRLDHHGLDQALALNRSPRGRLAHRGDIPLVNLYLRDNGPGYCLHGPLRRTRPAHPLLARALRTPRPDRDG
ncbi:hypothetical protein ACFXKF_29180 [Streptomyces scopuliridis]|uniref:hypothetical protein n=1 Tax=Streptomyces scopuliridis TaxID=452529 RepID=UPI00367CF79B